MSFFRVTRHTFGRTALLLSGGGGLGTFHLVRGLFGWFSTFSTCFHCVVPAHVCPTQM